VEDLRAWGPEPPGGPRTRGKKGEEPAYNKALDKPGSVGKKQLPPLMTLAGLRALLEALKK